MENLLMFSTKGEQRLEQIFGVQNEEPYKDYSRLLSKQIS